MAARRKRPVPVVLNPPKGSKFNEETVLVSLTESTISVEVVGKKGKGKSTRYPRMSLLDFNFSNTDQIRQAFEDTAEPPPKKVAKNGRKKVKAAASKDTEATEEAPKKDKAKVKAKNKAKAVPKKKAKAKAKKTATKKSETTKASPKNGRRKGANKTTAPKSPATAPPRRKKASSAVEVKDPWDSDWDLV